MPAHNAILLVSCPDQAGLVAKLTAFIHGNGGNIVHLDQHVDTDADVFFMRVEWSLEQFTIPREALGKAIAKLTRPLNMHAELYFSDAPIRLAIFVTSQNHCLYDLLARYEAGELPGVEIPLIIGNHKALEPAAQRFGIAFHHFDVDKTRKPEVERAEIALLRENQVDTIVMAKYMQILSDEFCAEFPNRIINIHHSFLPAFVGAKPYHQAHERGVKIIGATAHYATADLDQGPIIEQDVIHVSHKESIDDYVRRGKDLEKLVLSRAVWWHIQRKVLVHENRTVIFR
ncbi:MAG: formyltetrahydrofolate deformylase [Gammaproteobacteria bacterium]|nr:formyltetrahydrofolate deformylase [Gammaproteobacteria bacterium]